MIGKFKNSNPSITACDFVDILSNFTYIQNLYVVESDYFFASDSAIQDIDNWYNDIQLTNIIPLYDAKDVESNHEDKITNRGVQDIEITVSKGKYRFSVYYNYDINLYKKLLKLDNKPAYIYMQDKNKNVYGIISGTDIFGIRCENFTVNKIVLGSGDLSGVKVDLTIDPEQMDNINITTGVTFDSQDILFFDTGNTYSITNVQYGTDLVITVTVLDDSSLPLTGLVASDFSVSDNVFPTMTISEFSELGSGVYEFEFNYPATTGTIYIDYDYVLTYDYEFTEFHYVDLPMSHAEVTQNTFTQEIPTGDTFTSSDPVSVCVADYNIRESPFLSLRTEYKVFAGLGDHTFMTRRNAQLVDDNASYVLRLSMGSNFPVGHTPNFYIQIYTSAGFTNYLIPVTKTEPDSDDVTVAEDVLMNIVIPDYSGATINMAFGYISETPPLIDYTILYRGIWFYKRI